MTISNALLQLPARLTARGVKWVGMPGWQTRDRSGDGDFRPIGIIDHHDGMGIDGDNVPNNMIRPGQYGAQIWIKRNGVVYMLAAGRMPHAGVHNAFGDIPRDSGNRVCVGIETDYVGTGKWPVPLLTSWRIVRAELAPMLGITAKNVGRRVAGHKEIAPGRKPDPANLDMNNERLILVADLYGPKPPAPIPLPVPERPEELLSMSMCLLTDGTRIGLYDVGLLRHIPDDASGFAAAAKEPLVSYKIGPAFFNILLDHTDRLVNKK